MKMEIEFVGYVKTLANNDTTVEVEMPGDSALMGDILVEVAKRYDENFNKLVVDKESRMINVVAMRNNKIIVYETPIADGDRVMLTVLMGGG